MAALACEEVRWPLGWFLAQLQLKCQRPGSVVYPVTTVCHHEPRELFGVMKDSNSYHDAVLPPISTFTHPVYLSSQISPNINVKYTFLKYDLKKSQSHGTIGGM